MIKDKAAWEKWEEAYLSRQPSDFFLNLSLLEAMYDEAKALKVFPLSNPLEGLDAKIQMAKAVNVSNAA